MHKVHGPDLVDLLGHSQGLWLLPIETLTGFDPKVQLQLLVNPINPLVVPFKAFDVGQIQVAKPEAPVAVVVGELEQPIRNSLVLGVFLGLIPVAGLAHREDLAGQPNRDTTLCQYPSDHLTTARVDKLRPHHFFVKASFRISALSRSSAYIFFNGGVLDLQLLESGHHGCVHPAVFGPPLAKRC